MKNCNDCKWAFIAKGEDYVMCGYWQNQWDKSDLSIENYWGSNKEHYNLNAATGWASRTKPNKGESNWVVRGTATDGMLYNNQLLIKKDCYCSYFE